MTSTLTVSDRDPVAAMVARVRATPRGERVLFVIPSLVRLEAASLRVLRREAASQGVQVALVTSDPAIRSAAGREGLSTFRDPARAERARWRKPAASPRSRLKPPPERETVPPHGAGIYQAGSPSGFRPVAFTRSLVRRQSPWWGSLGLLVALALMFGGLLYATSIVIPAAEIRLTPGSERIAETVRLRAVSGAVIDAEQRILPAQTVSIQVSGEARTKTTGRRPEPATKSSGRVVFINMTSRQITVPQGTVVSTATGTNTQFVTTGPVELGPNGRAAATVQALLPGPTGNVRAGTVTRVEGPLMLSVAVANDAGFSGGTTAPQPVVTEEDKVRLQEELFAELKEQAVAQLLERGDKQSFIAAESVTFLPLSPTFTPFVGEVSDELFLSMSVQAVGLSIDEAGANEIALAALRETMPPGTRLISDTVRFTSGAAAAAEDGSINFSVTAEGELLRSIDASAARSAVLGLSAQEAAATLQERFALAQAPAIELGPDWLPYVVPVNLPALPWRIRVIVDWDEAAQLAMGGA